MVKAGWQSILAANVFVRRHGGTSFGESKNELVGHSLETLDELGSEYPLLLSEFSDETPFVP